MVRQRLSTCKVVSSESVIKKAICDYLDYMENLRVLYYFRAGSGCIPTAKGYFRTGRKGCPDIVVCLKGGKFVGLEVKTAIGKQSLEQVATEHLIEKLGGYYYVVRSVDDVMLILQDLGVIENSALSKQWEERR